LHRFRGGRGRPDRESPDGRNPGGSDRGRAAVNRPQKNILTNRIPTSNNTSTDKEPSHTYQSNGSKDISLTATDEDGNSCAISKTIKIINPSNTPQWQEVSPF